MDVKFDDDDLDSLEEDASFAASYSKQVVKSFRKTMQIIRAAPDERTFYQLRSLRFERLKGKRSHQYSMRLNEQWRLIVEMEKMSKGSRVVIKGIEDYH